MTAPVPMVDHRAVFLDSGGTTCSCGRFTGRTYVGWKAHYRAARRAETTR